MADTGDLIVRTIVSLAIVLSVIGVAFVIARRRATGAIGRPTQPAGARRGARRRSSPPAIDVVGRVGLTRATAAVAVRFGDRVVLVAANDQAPSSVLAEMSAEHWDELQTVREPIADTTRPPGSPTAPRNLLEALRDATARHG
jgi:hypothetical protein